MFPAQLSRERGHAKIFTDFELLSSFLIEKPLYNRDAFLETRIMTIGPITVFPSALQDGLWT